VEVVIVRHAMERWRTSNTARWTTLALSRARVVDHGLQRGDEPLGPLVSGGWLVFPGTTMQRPEGPPPRRLVFVDGSWSQARRMVQRVEVLRALPRLSLPPPPVGVDRLRRERSAAHMSTIEAVGLALGLVGEPEAAADLLALHTLGVERARSLK
jgi:DTW domain-containing protein YfiP